jgi:hypothetical protein
MRISGIGECIFWGGVHWRDLEINKFKYSEECVHKVKVKYMANFCKFSYSFIIRASTESKSPAYDLKSHNRLNVFAINFEFQGLKGHSDEYVKIGRSYRLIRPNICCNVTISVPYQKFPHIVISYTYYSADFITHTIFEKFHLEVYPRRRRSFWSCFQHLFCFVHLLN